MALNSKLLGKRIRQAREAAGLTQEELGSRVNRDQRSISQWEQGLRHLPAIDLPLFAEALNVPILFFYEGELKPSDTDALLLSEFHKLPTPESRQAIIKFINDLRDLLILHSK